MTEMTLSLHRSFNSSITGYFVCHDSITNSVFTVTSLTQSRTHSTAFSVPQEEKKPYLQKITIIVFIKNLLNGVHIYIKHVTVVIITIEQFRKVHNIIRHDTAAKTLIPVPQTAKKATLNHTQNLLPKSHSGEFREIKCEIDERLRSQLWMVRFLRSFDFSSQFRSQESEKGKSKKKWRENGKT